MHLACFCPPIAGAITVFQDAHTHELDLITTREHGVPKLGDNREVLEGV
jgi:hypothetical protein